MPHSTRALALLASLALALPTAAAVRPAQAAPATPSASAPTAAAPFSLWAPRTVTAYAFRKRTWTDLGLRAVAQGAPFELWSTRSSYSKPIRTVWRTASGDLALPTGSMTDFSGLRRFLTISITPRHGKTLTLGRAVCFNGWSERVRPDAPASSPYPQGCWNNPFSIGSVQGVQRGWATMLLPDQRPLPVGPGRYRVRIQVAPKYAALLGLSPAQSTRTVRLVVRSEGDGVIVDRRSTPRLRAAAHRPTGPQRRADESGPTPDLRAVPAWGISLSRNSRYLRFSATVWNGGTSPLVVDGFRERGTDRMDAYQYFFDSNGQQTGYHAVGHLHWDAKPSHQHWHFEDFARYTLLHKDKTEAAVSKKEAFCLANTDAIDLTGPAAAWQPDNTDLATSCGDHSSLSIREVLAAGWGDTYTQMRAGQSFRVDRLPNGVYYVAVTANPDHHLVESSTTNNVSLRRIRLGGTPTHRTVKVAKVGIIDDSAYGGTG